MRTVIVAVLFLIYFIIFLPVLAALFILRHFDRHCADMITFYMVRTFLRLELFISGTKVHTEGLDNIPDEPVLFVGNHRSYFDILSLYSILGAPAGFVAKKEMKKFPVLAQWMMLVECVFLDRSNIKEGLKSILEAIGKIKSGCSMVIFPEGTRNRSADKDIPGEFREGSLKIASKADCFVVPVAIRGTENCFEEHFPVIRPADVSVSFLEPFRIRDLSGDSKKHPAAYTRALIEEKLKNRNFQEIFR